MPNVVNLFKRCSRDLEEKQGLVMLKLSTVISVKNHRNSADQHGNIILRSIYNSHYVSIYFGSKSSYLLYEDVIAGKTKQNRKPSDYPSCFPRSSGFA